MALKHKELKVIEFLVYSDLKDGDICEELKISRSTLWRMRKNEEFQAALSAECRRKFKSLEANAIRTMTKLVEEGSFQASKYILDGNDYAPTEKHELDMTANITVDYGEE